MRVSARRLIERAQEVFDSKANGLADAATRACRGGFASGGEWMWRALEHLRGEPIPRPACNLNRLGLAKYTVACCAALMPVAAATAIQQPAIAIMAVPVFYAVEVQFVFLFPLAIDGQRRPFRESYRWTRRAGGTLVAMSVVMWLAATMLFGGFMGRGFVRSWCLGCLAVCIWYEELRRTASTSVTADPAVTKRVERQSVA